MYLRLTIALAALLVSAAQVAAQDHAPNSQERTPNWQEQSPYAREYSDTLLWNAGDTLRLSRGFVEEGSITLRIDAGTGDGLGTTFAPDSTDLVLDRETGVLRILPRALPRIASRDASQDSTAVVAVTDSSTRHRVIVRYRALPFARPRTVRLRELVERPASPDTSGRRPGGEWRIATPSQPLDIDSFFGSELEKSGYIGRGFTVGSNRDLNINSGFRLQLSGNLAENITVTGALTDENTPIQPEGNTRTIQELDKVFINIAGRNMAATLGDFNLRYSDSEFGRYSRKLSGVLGEARFDSTAAGASYATLKGTWNTMQFNGIDGVQGPYRLTGRNGEQPVLVLAGTEKVFIDGVEMTRGERNDYVIEYASGELFFTPARLVTSFSRITVDYEYAERQYVRALVTARASTALAGDRVSLAARYIREADDVDNPIDLEFSDADRALLTAAGDDAAAASRSGAVYVGIDSIRGTGRGQYLRVDTTIAGAPHSLYRYAPGADSATWSVGFSFVGAGRGDYRRRTVGTFEFAGIGRGEYAPLRLLPLPRLHQLVDLQLSARPSEALRLGGELGVSALDRNRFSSRDAGDDAGAAWTASLRWTPAFVRKNDVDLNLRYRDVGADFQPVDRINDIEFGRRWDIAPAAASRERLAEGSASWSPWSPLRISAGAGSLVRAAFSSFRVEGGIDLARGADSSLPDLRWRIEHIASDDDSGPGARRGRWLRQLGESAYFLPFATPRLRFEQEHRENRDNGSDSLLFTSLAFVDVRPGVRFSEFWNMTFSADVGVRIEDVPLDGAFARQSVDLLQQYGWSLRPWHDLSSAITVTVRDRRYTEAFQARGNSDLQTILTRAQLRAMPFNGGIDGELLYEVSTERSSRLQRVFLNVPWGQGNYEYRGDLNANGVQDEAEFEPTRFEGEYVLLTIPTDELFPVIDLKSSLRLRLRPERMLREGGTWWRDALRALSGETFARVEEKSEEENTADIYLLRLDRFLDDSTTLHGFQNIRQDLFLFERSQAFSLRARFDQRTGFSQFALGSERSYRRERSLLAKTQLVPEVGLQVDVIWLDDVLRADAASARARAIRAAELRGDLSYRPWREVEIGIVVDSRTATDNLPDTPVTAEISALTLRSITTLPGPGRLRVEVERGTVNLDSDVTRVPFELTDGRAAGTSWVWRVNFDYRLTSFMQATLSYLGRSEQERAVIHTARAEVKAFF